MTDTKDPSHDEPEVHHTDEDDDLLAGEFEEFSADDMLDLAGRLFEVDSKEYNAHADVLFSHLRSRFIRSVAYYKAVSLATAKLSELSNDIGDPSAIKIEHKDLDVLLSKLEEIVFVRKMGEYLGIPNSDLDLIVSNVINKEFPSGPRGH